MSRYRRAVRLLLLGPGVARAGAIVPMYFVNLTPVFAGLLSYFILGEPVGIYHVIGGVLIVAGIHLASRPDTRPPSHAEA